MNMNFLKGNKISKKMSGLTEIQKLISQKSFELKETLESVVEDPSISSNTKANIIVNATALICGIVAVQPIPFADLFILSPIQVVMVTYLSKVLGLKTNDATVQEILAYLVGTLGFGVLSQQVILGLYKTIIPFAGAITTVPLVYMSTFGLGMACKTLINAKKNNITLSKEELKRIRQKEIEKIKKEERDWSIESLKKQFEAFDRQEYKIYKGKLQSYDKCIDSSNNFTIDDIYNKKEELEKRISRYENILTESKVIYTLCFMKTYEIIKIENIIGQLDRNELRLELKEQKATYKLQGLADIYIRYENQKYVIEDVQAYESKINNMIGIIGTKDEMCHLANKEIREEFIKSFDRAKISLYIASPWLNNYVVNQELIIKIENALKRGVNIKIRYGIEDSSYSSQKNNRSLNSDRIANNLINKFEKYGQRFKMKKVNSHYKVMICDELYYIEGSYNFLSFAGEYDDNSNDHRDEGATYSTNRKMLLYLREKYFDF